MILERENKPEFKNAKYFTYIMDNLLSKYREQQWNQKYPDQKYNKVTQNDILRPKVSNRSKLYYFLKIRAKM